VNGNLRHSDRTGYAVSPLWPARTAADGPLMVLRVRPAPAQSHHETTRCLSRAEVYAIADATVREGPA